MALLYTRIAAHIALQTMTVNMETKSLDVILTAKRQYVIGCISHAIKQTMISERRAAINPKIVIAMDRVQEAMVVNALRSEVIGTSLDLSHVLLDLNIAFRKMNS
jgi:hypothetical protein